MSNVLAFLHLTHTNGIVIDIVPDDEHGQVDVDALETMISDRTKLIAITHIPTQGGLVNAVAVARQRQPLGDRQQGPRSEGRRRHDLVVSVVVGCGSGPNCLSPVVIVDVRLTGLCPG